jgi:hypothetical protein
MSIRFFITLFFALSASLSMHATIVSTTSMQSPGAKKDIVFLEDFHNFSSEIDSIQHHDLNQYFINTSKKTAFIIEIDQAKINLYKCYSHNAILTALYRKIAPLFYKRSIPLYKKLSLLTEMYINSIELHTSWPTVTTYPIDPRNFVDGGVSILLQKIPVVNNRTAYEMGFKRAHESFIDYTWAEAQNHERFHEFYITNDFISLDAYRVQLTETNKEINSRLSRLQTDTLISNQYAVFLREKLENSVAAIETIIAQHGNELPENTVNHLLIRLIADHGTFNNAWPHMKRLHEPFCMLTDIAMLETILKESHNKNTDQILVFAGMAHTVALQEYLAQLGYTFVSQTNVVWLEKDETQENSFKKFRYSSPWLANHLTLLTT